jgi:hypothetical protein
MQIFTLAMPEKIKPARHLAWRAYVSPRSSGDRFFLQRADCAGYRCCRHLALHNEDHSLQVLHQATQAI